MMGIIGQLNFIFPGIGSSCILLWVKMHQIPNISVYIANVIPNLVIIWISLGHILEMLKVIINKSITIVYLRKLYNILI